MIYNKDKKTVLSKNCKFCKSQISKTVGLMFRRKPKALVFAFDNEKIVSLHMFFVFFPIDIIYLNKNKEVVELKKDFKPFSLYKPRKKAQYIIELPAATIQKTRTSIGDKIRF